MLLGQERQPLGCGNDVVWASNLYSSESRFRIRQKEEDIRQVVVKDGLVCRV